MKTNILSVFDTIPYFTIEGVRQLQEETPLAAGSIQSLLYRWMKKGKVVRLKKGVYMTGRFYDLHRADADFSPAVSAILIPQSYLSLEYRLQELGMLTEVTYPVTAMTFKHARVIQNAIGTFSFRTITHELYTGFEAAEYRGIPFYRATPAKALFDFLYLLPLRRFDLSGKNSLAENLRLNLDGMTRADGEEFSRYVEISNSSKMKKIEKNLESSSWPL